MTVIAHLCWTVAFLGAGAALVSALRRDARDRAVPSTQRPARPDRPDQPHPSTHHRTGSSS